MKLCSALLLCSALVCAPLHRGSKPKAAHAKNVIIFLADAAGIPTLNAASIYGYNAPLQLFVQRWPSIGLSNTAPLDKWVTDSAAGCDAPSAGIH